MGESAEGLEFLRQLLAELFCVDYTISGRDEAAESIPGALVTDARSLYDSLHKEGSSVKDRRIRLELNLVRGLQNVQVRWIHSEQMIADELTKEVSEEIHDYAHLVRTSGLWTLGVDPRAPPSRRNRALLSPEEQKQVNDDEQRFDNALILPLSYDYR